VYVSVQDGAEVAVAGLGLLDDVELSAYAVGVVKLYPTVALHLDVMDARLSASLESYPRGLFI
jgi:hypothetical protein